MIQGMWDLRIKTRIQVGVAAFFAVVLLVAATSIYYLVQIRSDAESIFTRNYAILERGQRFSKSTDDFRVNWLRYTNGLDNSQVAIDKLYSGIYEFDSLLIDQSHLIVNDLEKSMVLYLQEACNEFKDRFAEIRFRGSFDTLNVSKKVLRSLEDMSAANDRIMEYQRGEVFLQYEKTKRSVNSVITYMIVIGGSLSFIALLLLWLLPNYIIGPINEIIERIKRIADKDFSQQMSVQNKDEFGDLAQSFNEMVLRLNEYEQMNVTELVKEKSRIEAIIDHLNDAILVNDEDGMVMWMNEPAEKLLGLPKQEVLGKAIGELSPKNFKQEALLETEDSNDSRTLFNFSANLDGRVRYYHKEMVQVGKENGELSAAGKVIIFYDITDFRERDLAKTDFMATLSHQFKTPISAMNISLSLLDNPKTGQLNEEQHHLLNTLRSQNERLLNMVNELLDFSQIETGKIRLKKEEIEPHELVNHSVHSVDAIVSSKEIQMHIEVPENLPIIEVDLEKLTWVLNNLLTNASRYTPDNGNLWVKVEKQGEFLRFEVKDEGPGISPEIQQKIFEKYQRNKFDQTKGTGLGLAIAREIIESHRGKIGVESQLGKGSVFYFTLPFVK
ncbi:MAG: HAMP domain-containing protein [Bacteroidetes bacterium]|nr:MAG: HAMP domain-containing protein [Bacteroidota bacterium]